MKKLSLLGMALLMCLSITACGQKQSSENNNAENETSTSENSENTTDSSENQQEKTDSDSDSNNGQSSENVAKNSQENKQPDSNSESSNSSEKSEVKAGSKEWPTADFISPNMKYDGNGELVATEYVNEGENEKSHTIWCIYYSGASLDDVKNYVNKLKSSGFNYYGIISDKEPAVKFEDGLYYWMGESKESKKSAIIYLCEEPDTHKNSENNEEKQFNLVIQLCNTTISELFK